MATQERVYTVDDVWRLEVANENPLEKYYLIDGSYVSRWRRVNCMAKPQT